MSLAFGFGQKVSRRLVALSHRNLALQVCYLVALYQFEVYFCTETRSLVSVHETIFVYFYVLNQAVLLYCMGRRTSKYSQFFIAMIK